MWTISNIKNPTAGGDNNYMEYDFKGLSTDEKPQNPKNKVGVNSIFLELDTGDFYYFDGNDWAKVGG
jgi:hypothetical protein